MTNQNLYDSIIDGSLVKRLRRRPLTAETRVRFPYGLLTIIYNSPTREQMSRCDICFFVCWILFYRTIKRRLALYWVWNYPDEWTVSGICKYFRVKWKKCLTNGLAHDSIINGSLVKRLRRRPLTAETRVRFPYGLLKTDVNFTSVFLNHRKKMREITLFPLK